VTDTYGVHPYRLAPQGLFTRRQLRERGLRPNGQEPAGEIRWRRGTRVAYLYRLDLAAPVRPMTAAKQVALDAAMKQRRTCPRCRKDRGFCIPRSLGHCWDCEGSGRDADTE
jgi:hypothetical protein